MDPKEKMRAALLAARAISDEATKAGRSDLSEDEVARVSTHLREYEDAKSQLAAIQSSDEVKSSLEAIGFDLGLERTGDRPAAETYNTPKRGKTLGQAFTESENYKQFLAQYPSGHIGEKARVQMQPWGTKALITGLADDSAGAFVVTDRQGDFELLGRRPLTVRDLISNRQTSSDTVEYVRQVTQFTAAAPVAEATTSAGPTYTANTTTGAVTETLAAGGGYKPEGSMTFIKVTETVKTIAEWVPATKRGLADASQLRGLIDSELRADLAQTEETQIVNGNGTGENLTGILSTSGIQTQAYSATVAGLDPLIETTLKAKTKVRTGGRAIANGFVLNPADWEKIQLARLAKNPQNEALSNGVPQLHGLPVVESEAIAAGIGLVADFRKAVLWDRQQATITATDSHADFFIRNLVAILGEERVAFGVLRPAAFVNIDLTV